MVWLLVCILVAMVPGEPAADVPAAATGPVFTPPPGEETSPVRDLIDRAEAAVRSGRAAADLLTDESFMPARAWPRFRDLIRAHAPAGSITLVPASEPGDPLRVSGTVLDARARPVKGALLYVYHTSAKGWYSDRAPHIGGMAGDVKHARLFGYLATDEKGHYEFRTIRPAGYPGSDLPAHIHVHITAPGGGETRVTEIRFDDDPRLTPEWRRRSRQEGCLVVAVQRGAGNDQLAVADFRLR